MTRDPHEALKLWITSTGYSHREVGALFGVGRGAVRLWLTGTVRVPQRVQARLYREGWLSTPRRTPTRHAPLCATPCRSCAMRRRWATGFTRRTGSRVNAWTPEEEACLRKLAGDVPLTELAAAVSAVMGLGRTPAAIRTRARHLGVELRLVGDTVLSPGRIAWLCGTVDSVVLGWIKAGWLAATQTTPRRKACWIVRPAAFEAFLREHPERYDWQRMPLTATRERRWRSLAQVVWAADPLYTTSAAARYLQASHSTVRQAIRQGVLPAVRGMRCGSGAVMIRRSDLLAWDRVRPTGGFVRTPRQRSA